MLRTNRICIQTFLRPRGLAGSCHTIEKPVSYSRSAIPSEKTLYRVIFRDEFLLIFIVFKKPGSCHNN